MFLRILLVFLFALILGCRRDAKKDEPSTNSESPASQTSSIQVHVSREKLGLINNVESKEGPAAESERFNLQANKKLSILANYLVSKRNHGQLEKLVSNVYQGSQLRPETRVVFRDQAVTVRRAMRNPSNQARHQGREGFESSIATLAEFPISNCKFKIVSIQSKSNLLETEVIAQIWGKSASNSRQVNSKWFCAWSNTGSSDVVLESIHVGDFEEVIGSEKAGFVWSDCTESVVGHTEAFREQLRHGLDYWLDRLEQTYGIMPSAYQGLAIGDVDGDGLDDLFVAQPGGLLTGLPNRLFLQNRDGTVSDVSSESGLDWNTETHCGLFVDLDNDGDQDLVVATVFGVVFAENDGAGKFSARAKKLTPDAPPMSLCAADFDGDRRLDVYACCYANRTSSQIMGRPIPYHDANNGGRNILFKNLGKWQFRNVTKRIGLDQNNRRFSFAASWEDFDNDGDLDLYVANDYGRNNLYEYESGKFRDVAKEFDVEDVSAGMSVSWGDFNRDGWFDVYISNMWSSAGKRIAYQRDFRSDSNATVLAQFQRHARGNSLFVNRLSKQQTFQDISVPAGVTMGRWAWSSGFADINNDGWEDIVVANGFITQEDKTDL